MKFAWSSGTYKNSFEKGSIPQLISIILADSQQMQMPRTMHSHNDRIEIVLILEGSGIHFIDGIEYKTKKGDILIYNVKSVHEECANLDDGMTIFSCAITGLHLVGYEENNLISKLDCPVIESGDQFDEIKLLLEMIYNNTLIKTSSSVEFANYILRALIIKIRDSVSLSNEPIDVSERELGLQIKDYIDNHFMEEINLSNIAEAMHVNPYYLSHIFKNTTDFAPMQYIIRRRIGEAQSYIQFTDFTITYIAMLVGFNNTNHFNSTFTKIVGISPGKYRRCWNQDTKHEKKH